MFPQFPQACVTIRMPLAPPAPTAIPRGQAAGEGIQEQVENEKKPSAAARHTYPLEAHFSVAMDEALLELADENEDEDELLSSSEEQDPILELFKIIMSLSSNNPSSSSSNDDGGHGNSSSSGSSSSSSSAASCPPAIFDDYGWHHKTEKGRATAVAETRRRFSIVL